MFQSPNRLFKILVFVFFILFVIKGFVILDPDFGWHYKFGEIVIQNLAVPKTDTFSYSMPSYKYVNHEWLTDVLIFKIYNLFGTIGLALIFGLITISSLLVLIPKNLVKYSLPAFILTATILFSFGGVRPQVISWLFIALIIKCIFEEKFYLKIRFYLPLIFLLWVNLHGAFASGFFLFGTFVFYRYLTKKQITKDLIILLTSFLVTFINPYFYHIWTEVFKTLSSSYLHQYIGEWQPITSFINFTTLFFMALSVTLIFLTRQSLSKFQIIIIIVFLIYSLTAVRHIPIFALLALPLTTLALSKTYTLANKNKLSLNRAILVYKILIVICLVISILDISNSLFLTQKLSETESYPKDAINYLEKNDNGNIYTDYSWGGYIIWKLNKKTFVDGRMAIWQNHKTDQESSNAFKEYLDIIYDNKKDFKTLSDKYHINTVLWHNNKKTEKTVFSNIALVKYLKDLFKPKTGVSFEDKLKKAGFKKVYQDDIAVVYTKK